MIKGTLLIICGLCLLNGCDGDVGSDIGTANSGGSQLQSLQLKATPSISKAGIAPNGTNILDLSTIGGHTDFTFTITNPNTVAVGRPYIAVPFAWNIVLPTNGPDGVIAPIYFYHTQNPDDCSLSNTMPGNSTCKIYATMMWLPSLDDTQVYQIPLDLMYDDLSHPHPKVPDWHNTLVSKCGYVPKSKSIDDVCKDKSMMLYYKTSNGQLLNDGAGYTSLDGNTTFKMGDTSSGTPVEQHLLSYINESVVIGATISTSAVPDISSSTFLWGIKPTYDGSELFWAVADDPYVDLTSSIHCFLGIGQCSNKFYTYNGDYTNSGKFSVGLDGSFWVGGHDYIKHITDVAEVYDKATDKFVPSNIVTEHLYGINPDGVAIDMQESWNGLNHIATFTCYRKNSAKYTSYVAQPLQNFNSNGFYSMDPIEAYNSVYVPMQIPNLYTVDAQSTYEGVALPMGFFKVNTDNGKCEVDPNGSYLFFPQYGAAYQVHPMLQINKKFMIIWNYYGGAHSATMSLDNLLSYGK